VKTAENPQDWSSLATASSNSSASSDSSASRDSDEALVSTLTKSARRRIFFASFAGTMVEWYDFFLYGFIAPLVFEGLFFPKMNATTGIIAVYATFAVGYASRPLGGLVFGHFGDRIGRKSMMLVTMLMMGIGTALIGLLPTVGQIGVTATYLLVILRFVQGFALGGESAASNLMVLETAEKKRRGLVGALLQGAGPVGVLSASLAVYLVSRLSHDDLMAWGWRIPFLLSAILVIIGLYIRLRIDETPTFKQQKNERGLSQLPLLETLRDYKWPVFVVLVVSITESTFYYLTSVYSISFVTSNLHMAGSVAIGAIAAAHAFTLISAPIYGALSDRVGRKGVFLIGIVASAIFINFFFDMLGTHSPMIIGLAVLIAIGVVHAPMYAMFGSFYGELFPTRVRFTGYSMGKAFGTLLGGGIAPMIAATLVGRDHGDPKGIAVYYACLAVVALLVILRTKETRTADIAR
jgi:MHS family shikimate/dehydroshikimate transporter-like MFS transporter